MTIRTSVSIATQVYTFRARDYEIFAGLDVDRRSIAATFTDHDRMRQSLRLPYSAPQLLNYVRKHFPGQRLAFVYEAGPTGFGLYDELVAAGHPCLVVAPSMVPTAPGKRVKTNRLRCAPGLQVDPDHLEVLANAYALQRGQVPGEFEKEGFTTAGLRRQLSNLNHYLA